jgi:hypothetical protein
MVGGVLSNFTSMAIAAQGGACSDPALLSAADVARVQTGGSLTLGGITLERFSANLSVAGLGALVGNYDTFNGHFVKYATNDLLASVGVLSRDPSVGSCAVQPFQYKDFLDSAGADVNDPTPNQAVHAGAKLTVTGSAGAQSASEDTQNAGSYEAQIGGINPGGATLPDFLNPGTYRLDNGTGASGGIGAFTATVAVPANLTWSNASAPGATISRSQNLTVTWTGADANSEYVVIQGSSANTTTQAGASFRCSAPAGAGPFTVPASILSALPSSGLSEQGPVGFLLIEKKPLRQGTVLSAPGLDLGLLNYLMAQLRNVNYQ